MKVIGTMVFTFISCLMLMLTCFMLLMTRLVIVGYANTYETGLPASENMKQVWPWYDAPAARNCTNNRIE